MRKLYDLMKGETVETRVTRVSNSLGQEKTVTWEISGYLLICLFLACFNVTLVNSTFG